MKMTLFYTIVLFSPLGCMVLQNPRDRVNSRPAYDYLKLADSIKLEIASNHRDYVYYYHGFGRTCYLIHWDFKSSRESMLYKVNEDGICQYSSSTWNFDHASVGDYINAIATDSIRQSERDTTIYISHSEKFILEFKFGETILTRGGPYHLLSEDQPLNVIISRIERLVLIAEQSSSGWTRIKGMVRCY